MTGASLPSPSEDEPLTMEKIGRARVSKCCQSTVHAEDGMPDFAGDRVGQMVTCWFVCDHCAKPCDTVEIP